MCRTALWRVGNMFNSKTGVHASPSRALHLLARRGAYPPKPAPYSTALYCTVLYSTTKQYQTVCAFCLRPQ